MKNVELTQWPSLNFFVYLVAVKSKSKIYTSKQI